MTGEGGAEDQPLPAGGFSAWLAGMQRVLDGEGGSDVPCGGCTACCTSSQFIHIEPDEAETLACIPADLLFPAPLRPGGNVLLGYDENGHCPMLVDEVCSIYDHRPRTCRTYDCRVFPAAGVELDDEDKVSIAGRARRWQFSFPSEVDHVHHDVVRAAARFVSEHDNLLPECARTRQLTQRAVLAVHIHGAFLHHDDETGCSEVVNPEPEAVRRVVTSRADAGPRAG